MTRYDLFFFFQNLHNSIKKGKDKKRLKVIYKRNKKGDSNGKTFDDNRNLNCLMERRNS